MPAFIAYVPLLFTHRGMVGADTKTYLYLDPGKLLSEAPYVWNSDVGLGSVTHQNIGYLWPMGPFYWLFETIGVPDWVAQRFWMGTLIFAAGMGVRYLLRTLGWGSLSARQGGVLVATLAYMLSPYLLNYSARISVILLPWTALPWLIAFTVRALRRGGWRDPALFALVVLTVGGVNATALLLIGLGPLLWLLHAVVVDREASVRHALATAGRIGVLTVAASLWWIAGLWAQGRYGLPVIRYTETYEVVAQASTAPEVLRGLGYWFFYGTDKLGPWIEPSQTYTTNLFFLTLSYAVPLLAMVCAALLRWRYRAFFLVLVAVGALAAIAAHPWDDPSFLGAVFKEATRTDAGLSLRSTPRAVPLLALGLSVCLGAGVAAFGRMKPRLAWPATAVVAALVIVNLPTLWNGQMIASNLERPEEIPAYWEEVADYLTATDDGTRALEVPGTDFASYRWGNTVDPVTPGLTERQYAARELFLWGSEPSADLQMAFDHRWHEETLDPEAVAPLARLMGVGDIVLRSDLQYERYRLARPRTMWELLRRTPGLDEPVPFGPTDRNVAGPELPLLDEIELATPPEWEDPPAVAVFGVQDRLPVVRTQPAERPLVVSGDGDGLVDLAEAGALDPEQAIFYAASFAAEPEALDSLLDDGADLVVTDTNRKRARSWSTLRETAGYTEQAGEEPLVYKPGDQRLELFPEADDSAATVTRQLGGVQVFATDYGNEVTLTANDRAAGALDGDPQTAWKVADMGDPLGQRLIIEAAEPLTTDHVELLQPQSGVRTRWLTQVRLTFDGEESVVADLGEESRAEPGQRVDFGERTFSRLEIEILADTSGRRPRYDSESGVGLAEVRLGDLQVREVIRPPVDLLDAAGESSADHRLTYLFTRLRTNPAEPVRTDAETSMARIVDVPTPRAFGIGGEARLEASASEELLDALLGIPSAAQGGVTATASDSLPGDLTARAHAAVDGDPTTAWSTPFAGIDGQWLDIALPAPTTIDRLDLEVVADGRHSVPRQLTIAADGDPARSRTVTLPEITDGDEPDATASAPVTFEPLTGSTFRVTIDDHRPVETIDWYTKNPIAMPAAIAELGLPGVVAPAAAETVDSGCRTDLVTVDGEPVPVRVSGPAAAALARRALHVTPCGGTESGLALTAGEHEVRTATGREVGLSVDRLVLASARDGAPLGVPELAAPVVTGDGAVDELERGDVSYDFVVPGSDEARWLSVGQSWNDGWEASANGVDLGPPVLIDGYANGWLLDPAVVGDGPLEVHVEWAPQRIVWIGIWVSVVAVAVCLALVLWSERRRRHAADPAIAVLADDRGAAERADHRALPLDPDLAPLPWRIDTRGSIVERASIRAASVAAGALFVVMLLDVPTRLPDLLAIPLVVAGAWWAFRSPRGRGVLGLAAASAYAVATAYIVTSQWRRDYPSDFEWPQMFERAHIVALVAVFLLLAEGMRDVIVRRREADPSPSSPPRTSSKERS
nr:alpha-(1->3)-arabinofuranosyltransferase family protein [Rhabdothermincola salaria]